MPNRNQIIAITVLGIVALMLGCKPDATGIGEVAGDPTIEPKPDPVEPKPDPVEPELPPHRELALEEKKLVGTYERKSGAITGKWVFLDNGVQERYNNGIKEPQNYKWSIVDKELHIEYYTDIVSVYGINPDNSITYIANIIGGKRTDYAKEQQQILTWKKIK